MSTRSTTNHWGSIARFFHWSVFLLIVAAVAAYIAHDFFPKESAERIFCIMLHKSFGFTIALLMVARIIWRFVDTTPEPVAGPQWQMLATKAVHGALYLMLILMPLSGALASQFAGRPIPFFGLFEVAPFLAENKETAKMLMGLHREVFAPILVVLIAGHVAAALWHQFVTKDGLMKRMLP